MDWVHAIRGPRDQRSFDSSSGLIAVFHALHRLLAPRHPPHALSSLAAPIASSARLRSPWPESASLRYRPMFARHGKVSQRSIPLIFFQGSCRLKKRRYPERLTPSLGIFDSREMQLLPPPSCQRTSGHARLSPHPPFPAVWPGADARFIECARLATSPA